MDTINYSQSWEDSQVLLDALTICRDDVILSVTSGGDNTLALLGERPAKIVAIDLNPIQNHLFALKRAAILGLSLQEALSFLGGTLKKKSIEQYSYIRQMLPKETTKWWDAHPRLIMDGVIHVGKFESFLKFFRVWILPLIHSKQTINAFLTLRSLEGQQHFYRNVWDTSRWRFLFRIFSSRFILEHFARQRGMFAYRAEPVGAIYEERFARMFTSISIKDNYFLQYCLTGTYGSTLPTYLTKESNTETPLEIVDSNLYDYLKRMPENSFSKYNLSDIFEALSLDENERLWEEIVRTARPNARVAYWNNLIERTYPTHLSSHIRDEGDLAAAFYAKDRSALYGSFHVHTINPR